MFGPDCEVLKLLLERFVTSNVEMVHGIHISVKLIDERNPVGDVEFHDV